MNFIYICNMETLISPYLKQLSIIELNLERVATRIVIENAELIIELLKSNQLSKGYDSNGNIAGTYSKSTSLYAYNDKKASGGRYPREDKTPGSPYNFDWSGEMFETMTLKASQKDFNIYSTTGKIKVVEDALGLELSDLTEKNNEYVNVEVIYPKLLEYILDNLFKI